MKAAPPCVLCDGKREERLEILIGPSAAICDRCVNEANRAAEASHPGATCTFCGTEGVAPLHVWGTRDGHAGGESICPTCVEFFNQVLLEAVGPEALDPLVRRQVERAYHKRLRETDRLELDIMDRRSRSVKQELIHVNLELITRNLESMLEATSKEDERPFAAMPFPARRRAIQLLDQLRRRLEATLPVELRPPSDG